MAWRSSGMAVRLFALLEQGLVVTFNFAETGMVELMFIDWLGTGLAEASVCKA
jgi:hypothetical protein